MRNRRLQRFLRMESLETRHLLAVSIDNLPATDVTHHGATVGVQIDEVGSSDPVISLFWGLTDGGTDFTAWEHRELMGPLGVGNHTVTLTDLQTATQYYYRVSAFSFEGTPWASQTATFTTLAPSTPVVAIAPTLFAGGINAQVAGRIEDAGGEVPTVTLHYGDNDGGDDQAEWDSTLELGQQREAFQSVITGLSPATDYFYRFAAENGGGVGWSLTGRFTTASVKPLSISEISAAGVTVVDQDNPPFGTRVRSTADKEFGGQLLNYDWVEIENSTDQPLSLAAYTLTDDAAELDKWRFPNDATIPARSAIVVFASGLDIRDVGLDEQRSYHTNFRLSRTGEFVGLVDSRGRVVDQLVPQYPPQTPNVSYGFFANRGQYMLDASPGEPNLPGLGGLATPPVFSRSSRTFADEFELEITARPPDAQIRYTIDGSIPDESSALYEGPILVTRSIEVRARSYLPDHVASEIAGESFIKIAPDATEFSSHLPLVIIENFDKQRPNRSRHVDFFMTILDVSSDTGRSSLLNEPHVASRIGIKVRGQSSSGDPKTPYRLETRDQHDQDLPITPLGLPADSDWVLHGPYSDRTLVHNSISFELGAEIGLATPRTRYVELFRNQNGGDLEASDYLGLYLLMEPIKRGPNRVDIPDLDPGQVKPHEISGGYILRFEQNVSEASDRLNGWRHLELLDGQKYSPEQKEWITQYVNQADAAIGLANVNRDYEQFIDVESFIDSLVMHELGRDQDAYVRSYYLYKDRGGKLVAGPLWDFNLIWNRGCCFSNTNPRGWQFDQDRPGQPTGWNKGDHNWNGKLMQSWEFAQRFIDRWTLLRQNDNVLALDSLLDRIDRHVAEIGTAVDRNFDRWSTLLTSSEGFDGPRFSTYQEHIDDMKDWITTRVEWIDSQFRSPPQIVRRDGVFTLFGGDGTIYYTLDGTDPFDSSNGEPSASSLPYDGTPIAAADGTRIIARLRDQTIAPQRTELTKTQWSAPVSQVMTQAVPASATNLAITELHYHPYSAMPQFGELDVDDDQFEFIEVQNVAGHSIDLTGVKFAEARHGNETEGIVFNFAPQILAAGQSLVVVANREAFVSRHGSTASIAEGTDGKGFVEGQFGGRLSNGGELISLIDAQGDAIQAFRYGDSSGWSTRADGRGSSLEVVDVSRDLNDPQNWRPSHIFEGTPGASATEPVVDVVINEILANSDPPVVDQLELVNNANVPVDLNGWYISDSGRDLFRFQFSGGDTLIQPGAYRVLDESQLGFGFKGQEDDDAWLVQSDSQGKPIRFADQIDFGPTPRNVSLGRWPDGTGPLVAMASLTFGNENRGPDDSVDGDLNGDRLVDVRDIQLLCTAIRTNDPDRQHDLNGDGQVDRGDLSRLVLEILATAFGDANLDGVFNSADLVTVLQSGEYEDNVNANSVWTDGDWNCDQEFDSRDLVLAFQLSTYSHDALAARLQQWRDDHRQRSDLAASIQSSDRTSQPAHRIVTFTDADSGELDRAIRTFGRLQAQLQATDQLLAGRMDFLMQWE